jgi:DNA-binding NtrC family response regulator
MTGPRTDGATRIAGAPAAATIELRAAQVDVVGGPDKGRSVRIDKPTFVIGSGSAADLQLTDDLISREHLRITLGEGGVRIRDVGSTNGTWTGTTRVWDLMIAGPMALQIGSTDLAFRLEATPVVLPVSDKTQFGGAIGTSSAMRHVFAVLERAAPSDATVLIEGESGSGKEVLAQAIHRASQRADGPFVAIDCGAIPANLIESELFGHERGAFTGAAGARIGAFEQANGGTIFLDEIGELPLEMQPKLLRVLETREVRPLGATKSRSVDVRIVAATNRNLSEAARKQEFRRDLFYRLAVVRVTVPPLRERREDILPIARAFLRRARGFENAEVPLDLATMLDAHPWPGNVRELRNVIDRYTVLGAGLGLLFDDVDHAGGAAAPSSSPTGGDDFSHLPYHEARRLAIDAFERRYIPAVLARHDNVVVKAATFAELGRTSFHRLLQRIRRDAPGEEER